LVYKSPPSVSTWSDGHCGASTGHCENRWSSSKYDIL
jgi:hypothetical protein